jgi:hypothetical protein
MLKQSRLFMIEDPFSLAEWDVQEERCDGERS